MIEALPALKIPVLRTPCLSRLTAFYRDAIGFDLVQHVPGVVSLLRHGSLKLQLWQYARASVDCRLALDEPGQCIFQLHARLARHARALLEAPPQLKPWGAWEFRLTDIDGNRLVFVQWAAGAVLGAEAPGLRGSPSPGR